jgi:hypothetical protein
MTSARRERERGRTSGPAPRVPVPAVPLADASPRMQLTARNARLLVALYGTDAVLEWEEDDGGNLTWVRVT